MADEDDMALKLALQKKTPVVYLSTALDYSSWHAALRRLVKGYNMGDALMFSVPSDRVEALDARLAQNKKGAVAPAMKGGG